MLVYMEDFRQERKDREKFQDDLEKYKQKLNDSEKIARKLNTQLHALLTTDEADGGRGSIYRGQSDGTPLRQVRFIHPYHPVDEVYQQQQRRGTFLLRKGQ
jgi:uncharacterized membrane protein